MPSLLDRLECHADSIKMICNGRIIQDGKLWYQGPRKYCTYQPSCHVKCGLNEIIIDIEPIEPSLLDQKIRHNGRILILKTIKQQDTTDSTSTKIAQARKVAATLSKRADGNYT